MKRLVLIAAAAGLTLLSACATPTPYQAAVPGSGYRTGYSDMRIEDDRYRISFSGNDLTSRQTVENYMLYHAAELTLNAGYAYFTFDDRETDARTYYRTSFIAPGFGPFDYPYYWRPYYWSSWNFGPSWRTVEFIPGTRYTAYSEIVLLTPEQANNNPQAIPAAEALARLGPLEKRG